MTVNAIASLPRITTMDPTFAESTAFLVPADRRGPPRGADRPILATPGWGRRDDRGAVWSVLFGEPALAPAEADLLDTLAKTHVVRQGERVLDRTQQSRSLVALCEGEVALGFRTADGTFRTERIVRGAAWLDLSAAWLDEPPAMDAIANTLSTVVELPCEVLQARLVQQPALAFRLIASLARQVQALAVNTHELMHKDAPARLAQWLRMRCELEAGEPAVATVHLHERKRDVASQLAITPETLSRLMRSFTQQGVIEVAGYTVRVLDLSALERLARG